jgi:hypothetical protein
MPSSVPGTVMPVEFEQAIADEILVAVKAGTSLAVAAAHADVGPEVPLQWLEENEEFAQAVRKARADLSLLAVGIMRREMKDNPKSAQYLAETIQADMELERLRALTT